MAWPDSSSRSCARRERWRIRPAPGTCTPTAPTTPNLMVAVIGCQADKTPEAVEAFLELLDNMPESPERFEAAKEGLINQYRTSRLDFRTILGEVRK